MANEAEGSSDAATSVAFRYELQDFIQAYRLGARPSAKRAASLAAIIVLLFVAIVWYEPDWDARLAACGGGALGGLAVFLAHRYIYLPLHARRMFANYPLLRSEHTFAYEPEGLRNSTDRTNAFLLWRDFVGWRADDMSVLLYTSPRQFIVVPTRLARQGFPIKELKGALARDFAMRG
ncbi:MAG: YcxB family protein [Rhodoblastus sp.]|nr:YcxB family protein [Rhodoblastus sp.]